MRASEQHWLRQSPLLHNSGQAKTAAIRMRERVRGIMTLPFVGFVHPTREAFYWQARFYWQVKSIKSLVRGWSLPWRRLREYLMDR